MRDLNLIMKKTILSFGLSLMLIASCANAIQLNYEGILESDGQISWMGRNYLFNESVIVKDNFFDYSQSSFNIPEDSLVLTSQNELAYEFTFQEEIDLSSASGKGTILDPEYENPVDIELLGKPFRIVGVYPGQIKLLYGTSGTISPDEPVSYNGYDIYSGFGENDEWARVVIKENGVEVETDMINEGASRQFADQDMEILVLDIRANIITGEVIGVDIVVGMMQGVVRIYPSNCDISGIGPANYRFPGETLWCIQSSGGSPSGKVEVGDKIYVVYKPTSSQTLEHGDQITLPNDYGTITLSETSAYPDLVVDSIELWQSEDELGKLMYSVKIKNIGDGDTGKGFFASPLFPHLSIYVNKTACLDSSGLRASESCIVTGYGFRGTQSWEETGIYELILPGTYGFEVRVDTTNLIEESDETNNFAEDSYTVASSDTTTTTLEGTTTTTTTIPTTTTITIQETTTTTTTGIQCPDGCVFDGSCIDFGTRLIMGDDKLYCDISKTIKEQKSDGTQCQNNYECESNKCEDDSCKLGCDGCLYNDYCLPIGTRRKMQYCSLSKEMAKQKLGEAECENNFECESNACIDNQCIEMGLIQRIIKWFLSLFGM